MGLDGVLDGQVVQPELRRRPPRSRPRSGAAARSSRSCARRPSSCAAPRRCGRARTGRPTATVDVDGVVHHRHRSRPSPRNRTGRARSRLAETDDLGPARRRWPPPLSGPAGGRPGRGRRGAGRRGPPRRRAAIRRPARPNSAATPATASRMPITTAAVIADPGQRRRLLGDREHPHGRAGRRRRIHGRSAGRTDVGQRAVGVDDAGAGALVPGAGRGQRAALDPGHHLRPGQPGEPGPDQRRDPGRDRGGEAGAARPTRTRSRRPTATPAPTPGAPTSTHGPRLESSAGWPAGSTLATASTPSYGGRVPGQPGLLAAARCRPRRPRPRPGPARTSTAGPDQRVVHRDGERQVQHAAPVGAGPDRVGDHRGGRLLERPVEAHRGNQRVRCHARAPARPRRPAGDQTGDRGAVVLAVLAGARPDLVPGRRWCTTPGSRSARPTAPASLGAGRPPRSRRRPP